MDLVSVIIPTYNRCSLLKQALHSVLSQTYRNLEVMVVDDGSTDETSSFIQGINDERVTYLKNQRKKGANGARNTGIEAATGKYLAFLDDDDQWLPAKVEKQLNAFNDAMIGLVYTEKKLIEAPYGTEVVIDCPARGDLTEEILVSNLIGTTSSVMLKRELLEETGYFDENLPALQDYDLWIRLCEVCRVNYVAEPLILYYNREGFSQISDDTSKYIYALEEIEKKYKERIASLPKRQQKNREMNKYFLIALKANRNNNPALSRYYLRKALAVKIDKKAIFLYLMSFTGYAYFIKLRKLIDSLRKGAAK